MTIRWTTAILSALYLATLNSAAALAQSPFERVEQGWHFFGQGGQPSEVRLGVGAGFRADYEGSDDYEAFALPLFTARNVLGFNFQPFALSYNLAQYNSAGGVWGIGFGPRVAADFGRDQDANAALAGLGDVDASIMPGGFVNVRLGPVIASLDVGHDVADGHGGTVADLGVRTFVPLTQQIVLSPGVDATWVDDEYMQSNFGVNATQAANSAYSLYTPEGGLKSVGASVNAIYNINENWAANALVSYDRLLGDAADSLLVSGQGSANQYSVILGVSRGFSF